MAAEQEHCKITFDQRDDSCARGKYVRIGWLYEDKIEDRGKVKTSLEVISIHLIRLLTWRQHVRITK